MRKTVCTLLLCLGMSEACLAPASAANQVNTMDVQAVIDEAGSMQVTQVWEGKSHEGTEHYIPMNAPEYLTISGLQVSDAGGAYSDRDGGSFGFVNDGMNTTPTNVRVEIPLADRTPITDKIADIWGFGYRGQVKFSDGAIFAYTESSLYPENHVTVPFSLKKGILSPARKESGGFEAVKQTALEGSDYASVSGGENGALFDMLLGFAILVWVPIVLVVFFRRRSKKGRAKKLNQFAERFGYFRDIPNGGNLNAAYAMGRRFDACEDGAILATGMLRLIQLGCLAPLETQEVGFVGKTKETVSLRLAGGRHDVMNEYDEYLYTMLESAAGVDAVLQAKELTRFADRNDKLLRAYLQKCAAAGEAYLNEKHCLKRWVMPGKLTDLTPAGERELGELLGLKRYLTDFSLVAERGVGEIPIWRELLTYAMLFGIADRVAEQMKALYPQISDQLTEYSQSMTAAYSCHYLLYTTMKRAEQQREQERRGGGGGGLASLGGGGDSIGGSSGGGTR
ncbi:DUF2207 domain-containing protein [Oscillibacter sp. GMB15532]|uniref:DUF2207 family protein n=1 Tax=Oscillibacter sp. GMB15532 TaxID=3230022 RepID=UPI0034DE044F